MPRKPTIRPGEPIREVTLPSGAARFEVVLDVADRRSRRQIRRRFKTLVEARKFVAETKTDLDRGSYMPKVGLTLSDLADRWLAWRSREAAAGGIREVSVNGYASALSRVRLHLGDREVQSLTTADVRGLLVALATAGGKWRRPLSHRSIVYALGSLKQVLDYGVEAGILATNVAEPVKPPKRKPGSKRPIITWSVAELVKFRAHLDGVDSPGESWLKAAVRLWLCGLRRSEVLGLTWEYVDLDAGTIRVERGRVKTGRKKDTDHNGAKSDASHRTVPVDEVQPGTVAALKALWLAQGRPESGLVVVDLLGEPVHPDAFSARLTELFADAGVPDLRSIHNVRHTIARALHDDGVSPREAASLLGHTVATHIAYYVPTDDEGAATAAKAAGRIFSA